MEKLPYVKTFRDLVVYRKSRELANQIFMATIRFPREEMYSLTDQIRRSSRSVGAQIAEAWAKRRYEAHFISKLTDADAELQETQHWLEVAQDCGYLDEKQIQPIMQLSQEIGRFLGSMMAKSEMFCGGTGNSRQFAEPSTEYYVDSFPSEN